MKASEMALLKRALKSNSPVYLEWLDSVGYSTNGWMGVDELKPDLPVMATCGFVIALNDDSVTLCLSHHRQPGGDNIAHVQQIPLFAITYARRLA